MPDTYLVIDTETSGLNPVEHRIVQMGFCYVRGREIVDKLSFIVKRPPDFKQEPKAVATHKIDRARMDAEGLPVEEFVALTVGALQQWRDSGGMFMGHNVYNFDVPFIEHEARLLGHPFKFGDNEVLDTGMLVKAGRLGVPELRNGEPLRSFYVRMSEVRATGVKWSLAGYCYDAFNLGRFNVGREDAHDAGVDCLLTHHLFQELRKRLEERK